jgi:hypothetical protein
MKYLKIINGEITYPYTIKQLYRDNPNTIFPKESEISTETLNSFGVYKVNTTTKPIDYTKTITEGTPQLVDGEYQQIWNQVESTEEEINTRIQAKWLEIREHRNTLLSECDWTQFQDSPITGSKLTEWQTYRQSLRDLTNNDNPFTLEWPAQPE